MYGAYKQPCVNVCEIRLALQRETNMPKIWLVPADTAATTVSACRIELCRGESGELLRRFSFEDCEGGAGSEFRGVHRPVLLKALADALPSSTISFDSTVAGIAVSERAGGGLEISLGGSGAGKPPIECDLLIGADGIRSAVAKHLGHGAVGYSGYSAIRGVCRLEGDLDLESIHLPPDTIRQLWGAGIRAGLYPMNDREVYWYVYMWGGCVKWMHTYICPRIFVYTGKCG